MSRVWVADTCSLIEVRRCVVPSEKRQEHSARKRVFEKLEGLVALGRLVFPHETYNELKEGGAKLKDAGQDHPLQFVERCKAAGRRAASPDIAKALLADPLIQRVVDRDAEKDEADIWVLSLAVELQRQGQAVGVLTEERRDGTKLSMTTACGLLGLVCLPMKAFLHAEGIWTWQ